MMEMGEDLWTGYDLVANKVDLPLVAATLSRANHSFFRQIMAHSSQ